MHQSWHRVSLCSKLLRRLFYYFHRAYCLSNIFQFLVRIEPGRLGSFHFPMRTKRVEYNLLVSFFLLFSNLAQKFEYILLVSLSLFRIGPKSDTHFVGQFFYFKIRQKSQTHFVSQFVTLKFGQKSRTHFVGQFVTSKFDQKKSDI